MLKLSSFFHLNLMYSSVGELDRGEVIRRCYHPLLDLADSTCPVTLEATGLTLEMIADLDGGWLEKLKAKLAAGAVEFVGSGYSQIIAPLVPGPVNQANLRLGCLTYQTMLGIEPEIWLVNEMAYSGGLPQLYQEVGAKALIMEWNNTWRGHPDWNPELRYHHQLAVGCEGTALPVLWVDTIDFQKFQRLAHGQLEREDWIFHWESRAQKSGDTTRFACLYGSDAEVFDYRPGRYPQEGHLRPDGEWLTLGRALEQLAGHGQVQLTAISAALQEPVSEVCGQRLRLECTAQPVVVKKQEKYNLNRWAVTGRGDLEANTTCHVEARALVGLGPQATDEQWRRLLWRWSSDFRTHITESRWSDFQKKLPQQRQTNFVDEPHSGTRLEFSADQRTLDLATDTVRVNLDLKRGLALRSVVFPVLGQEPALGTLPHGYFDDIAFGADFFTGHTVVQYPGQPKLTDLQPCAQTMTATQSSDGNLVVRVELHDGPMKVTKQVELVSDRPQLILTGQLELPSRHPGEIHPVHLTAVPGLFQTKNLEFRTHNGGLTQEKFSLAGDPVHHGASYSTLVTAKGGLGATAGLVVIGDGQRELAISHDPGVSALVPTLRFEQVRGGKYFLRLRYSAQETDETFVGWDRPWQVEWRIVIEARQVD